MEPAALTPNILDRAVTPFVAASRWDADPKSVHHVADGASFTYRLTVHGKPCYLRLTPPGWQSMGELRAELSFVNGVYAAGVSTALPIRSRLGKLVEPVPNRDHEMLAVVFEAAPGKVLKPSDLTAEHAVMWGRLLANLHNAASYQLGDGEYRRGWRAEFARVVNWLPIAETAIHSNLRSLGQWLGSLPQTPDVFGLVHFDVQGDNVLWAGRTATLIDFDDCLFYWFAGDIARALATFEDEDANRRRQLTRWLLDGYRQVRAFDTVTSSGLPQFGALTNIGRLAWESHRAALRGSAPDSQQTQQKLRDRIAATMSGSG